MPHTLPPAWTRFLREQAQLRASQGRQRAIHAPTGLDFRSNDYLGLRQDGRLAEAAREAAKAFGSGSGAARLLGGTTPYHEALEADLAAWKGQESCLLFNSGYQANVSVIPALIGPGDAVFSDALNHASLIDGCRLAKAAGAKVFVFPHQDLQALETQLCHWRQSSPADHRALIVTDSIFSMDGDAADLAHLAGLAEQFEALLMVDEAHATGLLGPTGGGLVEALNLAPRIPIIMGTLGKALGSFGAFLALPILLRDHLINACRGFIFSTALPAPVVAAAHTGVTLAQRELWRRERALGYAHRLRNALALPPSPSAIVPWILGNDACAVHAAQRLQQAGFDVRAVRPPTVPAGTARLRITTGAHQTQESVDALMQHLLRLEVS